MTTIWIWALRWWTLAVGMCRFSILPGIVTEHLETRKKAGLFDVSHMGRLVIRGRSALDFLQHVLTNNAAGLELEESQYTLIPNDSGGAVDDAYLYRFTPDGYMPAILIMTETDYWIDPFRRFTEITIAD